jgi:hypothetical protein
MLKRVRDLLDRFACVGFTETAISEAVRNFNPTFEEFFGLLILMQYYFHPSRDVLLVIEEFYQRHRQKLINQYPNDDRDQRMELIATNTAILADDLKNETDLEMATKNAVRELFSS